jgi:hypothetical protein
VLTSGGAAQICLCHFFSFPYVDNSFSFRDSHLQVKLKPLLYASKFKLGECRMWR